MAQNQSLNSQPLTLWLITREVAFTNGTQTDIASQAASLGLSLKMIVPEQCVCRIASDGALSITHQGAPIDLPDAALAFRSATGSAFVLAFMNHLERAGVPVLNSWSKMSVGRDKYLTLQYLAEAGVPVPMTHLAPLPLRSIEDSWPHSYPVVAKLALGAGGDTVHLCSTPSELAALATDLKSAPGLLLQSYVPSEPAEDIRVYVVGGEVVGAVVRQAPPGQWKANIAQGGRAWEIQVDDELERLSLAAADAIGFDFVGIDFFRTKQGYLVNEVNPAPMYYTADPRTYNVTRAILDLVVSRVAAKPQAQ